MACYEDKKKFYCREWAFQKLSHCLDQRPASKTCGALLLGGPGCGKSTFCSEICWPSQGPSGRQQRALNRRLLCYHYLAGQNEKSLSLSEFVRSLVTQILNHSTESQRERSIRRKLANEAKRRCSEQASECSEPSKQSPNISQDSSSTRENLYGNIYMDSLSPTLESKKGSEATPPIPNLPVNPRTLIADAYLEKLKSDPEIQFALRAKNIELNPDDCLKRALLFPLLEIDPPKSSLFILVDSIDEHSFIYSNSTLTKSKPRERTSQSRTIAELLANHHHLFPQWLLLVCTARKQSKSIAKMFTGFRKLSLDDLRKSQVVRDVQQYILARLDQENSLRQHISRDTAEMLNQLHIKSNGCFLYLEKVLDGVSDNFIVLREVREIPGTLNGLYLWLSQRLFNRRQFAKVQPLLNVILAAKCALNEALLFDIMKVYNSKMTLEDFKKRFHLLKRILIISKNGTIKLFHHSFAEWLLDIKHCTQKYLCNIFHGHCTLAMYYTLQAKYLSNQEIYDYAFHLSRMEQYLSEAPSNQKCPNLVQYKFNKERQNLTYGESSLEKSASEVYSDLKALQNIAKYENNYEKDLNCMETLDTSFIGTEASPQQNNLDLNVKEGNIDTNSEKYENIPLTSPCSDVRPKTPIYGVINKDRNRADKLKSSANALLNKDLSTGFSLQKLDNAPNDLNGSGVNANQDLNKNVLDVHTLIVLWLISSGANVEECLLEGNEMAGVNFGAFLPTDQKVLRLLLEAGAVEQADPEDGEYESQLSLVTSSTEPSPEPLFDLHDLHGQAALHVAARLGQAQVVKVLLEAGADLDQADADGWTPLRAAAWGGHTEVVELLVKHGCTLDSVDAENRTALRAAAWSGHEEIVKILLEHGANVNLTDHEGRTALIAAAYMGHAEIVEHLLNHGADINHADADGRTALSVAALCAPRTPGANVVATLLERGATVDHKDKEGMTPLLVASFEGHKEVCELLLESEADVDHCDHGGRSPLWAAASMGHAPVVALLLFWGCCIDSMDSEGRTVLSVAAAQGCVDVVKQLLDRGLDEQHRDNSGWTPLHYAAFEGHQDVCEALLEAGARIDEVDNEGKAALVLAAQGGHTALVNLFLDKYNAPCDQRPHDGKTALRLAALEAHYDVVQILISHGSGLDSKDADGRSTLYVLALDNRLVMAKFFIQQGADVETRDLEGRTPLHVSSWQGHTEMVALLLTCGHGQVDAVDLENRTALHSASWQGHHEIVKLLLDNGAIPDHTCNQGATALGIAAQEGHELCVVALLEHGADPNHSDACGRNALRVAAKSGHRGVVRLLEEYNMRCHKMAHTSSSANSITSGSTAETKACSAVLYPGPGTSDWSDQQRRSMVSLGNHSSNSKSSSNLTGSSHSSKHGDRQRETVPNPQPLSFTQQLQQCTRGGKTRPLSKLLSPLQSEPQSPIYASPPLSPVHDSPNVFVVGAMNIYQPVLRHNNFFSNTPDTHFARDTHMRIILGNSGSSSGSKNDKKGNQGQENSNISSGNSKPKRNGIVTNPALRLVANVKNGLDTAAANFRKSTSSANPSTKTNSFHWRKETPL